MIAEAIELGLPDVRSDSSAVACLLAICDYFHVEPHGGGDFERLLERAQEGGDVSPDDIAAAAADMGLHATIVAALTPENIRDILGEGKPILTDLGGGFYIAIHGVSSEGFLVVNPTVGTSVIPLDEPLGWGMVVDSPDVERREEVLDIPGDEHYHLAQHYSDVWNHLHDQGEMVPHWELNGAHENLAGTDWHVDLGHDGIWRPMHQTDRMRVYPHLVEKGYAATVEKAKRKVDPQQGLFGWESNKDAPQRHPRSSTEFEGMHPRRGHGSGGGQFAKINTGKAPGQLDLFSDQAKAPANEDRGELAADREQPQEAPDVPAAPKGGVTMAGELPNGEFERLHPRQPKGEHGGEFAPKGEGATATAGENEEEKSRGHVAFAGDFEYYSDASGSLFRAKRSQEVFPDGYRQGRWEAGPDQAAARLRQLGIGAAEHPLAKEEESVKQAEEQTGSHEKATETRERKLAEEKAQEAPASLRKPTDMTDGEIKAERKTMPKYLNEMTPEQQERTQALYAEQKRRHEEAKRQHKEEMRDLLSKDTYPDGRLVPKPGDEVYQNVAGAFGMPATLKGEVFRNKQGNLKVRVTGGGSLIADAGAGKVYDLDPYWTVKDDPAIQAKKEARQQVEEAKKKKEEEDRAKHDEILSRLRQERGEVTTENVKPGDVLEMPDTPLQFGSKWIVTQVDPKNGWVFGHKEGDPEEDYSLGKLSNYVKAESTAKPQEQPAAAPEPAREGESNKMSDAERSYHTQRALQMSQAVLDKQKRIAALERSNLGERTKQRKIADLQASMGDAQAKSEESMRLLKQDQEQPVAAPEPKGEENPVDLPKPTEENSTNVHEEPKQPEEESHVEPRATAEPPQRTGGSGYVSQPERRGDDSGSAGGDDRKERPASVGPRIVTARSEHTRTADTGLVPESLRGHLNEAQQQGTALAIDALMKHGGFLLADGTGVGKTRQQLAVAQHFLQQGRKVVIVSPAEVIKPDWKKGTMSGSFAHDSGVMGVPVKLTKGDGEIAPGAAHITTYNELGKLKNQIDKNTIVIFDESHFMKNRDSARFKHGNEIMEKAASVMYATATPGDKPLHIAHLARAGVFGNVGKTETYQKLGMKLVDQRVYGGGTVKVWQIDPKVGYMEAARRLSGLFDQLTSDGLMVKRELAMNNVQFQADRVSLKEQEHNAIQKVYEDKLKETASRAFPDGNKAVALMAARMAQEPYKIPATVQMIQKEMAEGRSPIVFLGRVNDISDDEENDGGEMSEINYGTAGLLKEALIAAGIAESDIGELHGAATKTPDAKKKAMEKFQGGKTKLMIATVQSGGTGINLDDTTGERPRTVIMMTPPLTANDMAQAIGRVHRLNTKSESRVRGVLADTDIDDWNAGILEKKFRTLGAVVSGESTRGQAAYMPPEELEELAEEKPKEPFKWGESLKPQPKVYQNTPFAHNDILGQFGGRRVNRNGEWTTQFPSQEHLERYRAHVAPKAEPPKPAPAAAEKQSEQPKPQAPPMSTARKEAIHQGLRQLHVANEDRAREQNGEGFNKFDSDFGGQLAEQSSLTDRQAEAAAKLLGKYKRQLGEELHKKITTADKGEVAEQKPSAEPTQAAPPPEQSRPSIAIRRQKTSRGERSLYSFDPSNSFWDARKAGKIPSNVTVRKDPRSGRWEASVWGENDKEIHDTVEAMRKAGVRL